MKTFAITGVASGIGAELAKQLKQDGHRIIGFDITEKAEHVDVLIPLDLNHPASIQQAIAALNEPLDGLCNNAGIPPREQGSSSPILQVNYLGQRQFTQAILNKLKPGSAITNMASRAGHGWRENINQILQLSAVQGADELAEFVTQHEIDPVRAYNLSKEALILWTISETELLIKKNLRMNSISPGAVATGISADFLKAFGEKMSKNVARAGRQASVEDVARVAIFLLSDNSQWLKGIDVPVDGGMGSFAMIDKLGLDAISML